LKTPLDDLTAENSMLTTRNEELADEITKLKPESTKARELANAQRIQAETKEKGMNQCLQTSLDALRGEFLSSSGQVFLPKNPFVELGSCFSCSRR
jgi:hypothetical protein